MIGSQVLSHNASRSLAKGLLVGGATMSLYVLVVVLTTPNIPAAAAINAAFLANSIVIGGSAAAIGTQMFFSSYSKALGCKLDRKGFAAAGAGGSAVGSFFSFFSLVPLGCCGSWLFILSFLPSVFGSTLSVALIEYSRPLSYTALAAALGLTGFSGLRLYRRTRE